VEGRILEAAFDAGLVTSDAGALLHSLDDVGSHRNQELTAFSDGQLPCRSNPGRSRGTDSLATRIAAVGFICRPYIPNPTHDNVCLLEPQTLNS
jgi:hypothetical protein